MRPVSVLTVLIVFSRVLGAAVSSFEPIDMPDAPTSCTLSEDGKLLLVAHEQANKVTAWDVRTAKLVKTVDSPTPRQILSRGNFVLVAAYDDGQVLQYSLPDWKLVRKFAVDKKVADLSAGVGGFFNGKVMAGCESNGYSTFLLDTRNGSARPLELAGKALQYAFMNFSGNSTLRGGDFPFCCRIEELSSPGREPVDMSSGQPPPVGSTPRQFYSYVVYRKPYGFLDPFVDVTAPLVYSYDWKSLCACLPDPKLTPLKQTRELGVDKYNHVDAPPPSTIHQSCLRQAATLDGQTYLYMGPLWQRVGNPSSQPAAARPVIFRAVVPAFDVPDLPRFDMMGGLAPADAMTITEDGQLLLLSHTAQNRISVYDVKTNRLRANVACKSPGPILCRGDRALRRQPAFQRDHRC